MKFNLDNITIKKLEFHELETLISWAAKEGWNPGKHDAKLFWDADPDGFYGCFYQNNLIAGGSVVAYNNEFGFMGLFIVHPDFRNDGIGRKLWHARRDLLLSRLQPNSTIGMDGVLTMQPFYQKGGFNIAFKDERYEFKGQAFASSNHISPISIDDFNQIAEYDTKIFGCKRTQFLTGWLFMTDHFSFCYKIDNAVEGYAVIRKAETGFKIGPLFANNAEIAEALFKSCISTAENNPVYLDIPTTNEDAVNLVHKYGGNYVFECARMYHGKTPNTPIHAIFGITTFELG